MRRTGKKEEWKKNKQIVRTDKQTVNKTDRMIEIEGKGIDKERAIERQIKKEKTNLTHNVEQQYQKVQK